MKWLMVIRLILKGGLNKMSTFNEGKLATKRGTNGFGRSLMPTKDSSEHGTSFTPEIVNASGKAIVRYVFFISSDADMRRVEREVRRDYRALSRDRKGLAIRGIEYS